MNIVKSDKTYSVSEQANKWVVKTHDGKLDVTFDIAKDLCPTIDALSEYLTANDLI